MSDTNSKGPKKDTDKIQFIKIGSEGSVSSGFPKDDEKQEPKEAPHVDSSLLDDEPIFTLDEEVSQVVHADIQVEGVEPELEERIGQLKTQIEAINDSGGKKKVTASQIDLLKKYIALKETEVRDLKEQHKQYQRVTKKLSAQLEKFSQKNHETLSELETIKRREDTLKREYAQSKERFDADLAVVKNDYEEKLRRAGDVQVQSNDLAQKREEWKEKVREDLKRIKLKERELENKYELLRRDTQALLDSKDKHVLELKKKNDALELEMESFEEKLRKFTSILGSVDSKKRKLIETLRLAITLLEQIDNEAEVEVPERKAG